MFRLQVSMIIKHTDGSLKSLIDQAAILPAVHYGNKAKDIDNKRNGNKEHTAKAKKPEKLLFGEMSNGVPEEKDSQTKAGVNPRPLGCNAKGHADAAYSKGDGYIPGGEQIRPGCLLAAVKNIFGKISVYIVIHHQDKERRKDIDGGNPGKGEMHTVKDQQTGGGGSNKGAFKQPFCKKVHKRDEQNAENY